MPHDTSVTIVSLFPDLFGAYGDTGNLTVLAKRLEWRDIPVSVITVKSGETIPESADLYVIGGGEDALQVQASRLLQQDQTLNRSVDNGATVFGVCAGLQVLCHSFETSDGSTHSGIGLLDATSTGPNGSRAIGEVLVEPDPQWALPPITGFENHSGLTRVGPSAQRLGRVTSGTGSGSGSEGVVEGHVLGTYLHGPVLARNPALADMLLGWVVGDSLTPLDDAAIEQLRAERLAAVQNREEKPKRPFRLFNRKS